ncbi:MAG: RNase adapter RapZ [Rickettsiales bacterium]
MKLILITGMSGAGKTVALRTLEDSGFEAIDNLPLNFLDIVVNTEKTEKNKDSKSSAIINQGNLAIGCDIRSRDFSIEHFTKIISKFRNNPDIDFKMLFLDADDETLRRRFSETRRRHPLAQDRPILDGISHERSLLDKLREPADLIIDTSDTKVIDLRQMIISNFARDERKLSIVITSFSFKHGIPREADTVFDVRFLKNPYYDEELRELSGQDIPVGEYIESDNNFSDFFGNMTSLISPLLPRYLAEGKNYLTIAIGCTGGRHRSVYVSEKLYGYLKDTDYETTLRHRDLLS